MGLLNLLTNLVMAPEHLDLLPELAVSEDYDADLLGDRESAFTETHFFRPAELESLLADADLTVESVVGFEGVASVYSADELLRGQAPRHSSCSACRLRDPAAQLSGEERGAIQRLVEQQGTIGPSPIYRHTCSLSVIQ